MAWRDLNIPNYFDAAGSFFHLPELGISERLAGGKQTINTGRRNVVGTNVKPAEYYSQPNYFERTRASIPAPQPPQLLSGPPRTSANSQDGYDPEDDITSLAIVGGGAGGAGGGGGSATKEEPPNIVVLPNGRSFNLDTLDGRSNYFDAANADTLADTNANYAKASGNIRRSKENLDYNLDRKLQGLKEQRLQLQKDKENYFSDLEKEGRDFVTGKFLGDAKRQNFFSGLGANAFQSSQATSQDYADQQFDEGLAEQQTAKVAAGEKFDTTGRGIDQEEQDTNRQYTQDATDLTTAEQEARTGRDATIRDARTKLVNAFAPADWVQGVRDFGSRYQLGSYTPVDVSKPDLTRFGTYTNFEDAQANPGAATGATPRGITLRSKMAPEDEYFGYKPNQKDKERITNYFAGKFA